MNSASIFISHAGADDAFVAELRQTLEAQGLPVWVDSRNLRGGAKLAPEIERAIQTARQVIVVLSPATQNSTWVRQEIRLAEAVELHPPHAGYCVIPLLLPGVEDSALGLWFGEDEAKKPLAIKIPAGPGGLSQALPAILAALGERLPTDAQPMSPVAAPPLAELLLRLVDPKIQTHQGKRRFSATATLTFSPAQPGARPVESKRYPFTAPLGPIEGAELRWYLEEYHRWPVGLFQQRAEGVEAQLPRWGQALYHAALDAAAAQEALSAWQQADAGAERRFSVEVDNDLPQGARAKQQAAANEAAAGLLSLPWELLHDGRGYLFQGKAAVRVRRRRPNRHLQPARLTGLPLRLLLVSPRPAEAGYFDHRSSALPLVAAVEQLGELVELTVLTPPTFPALEQALQQAAAAQRPFDVLHFDGHGVYDRPHGLGALCFEAPPEAGRTDGPGLALIHAEKLAAVCRDHRLPLVFLDACQTAQVEDDPTASVAARLLDEGVAAVVAMSHSVLVETAHRFVQAFYGQLAGGAGVGRAMLAGQQALYADNQRGRVMGAGELRLHDWFVPVLYQEQADPPLVRQLPPAEVQQLQARQRRLSLGDLPEPPAHRFIGRSRDLLALERRLTQQPYAVITGQGGAGKTTLAVELARWLVRSGRFERAAFVSLEPLGDVRAVLDSLGRQLLPGENQIPGILKIPGISDSTYSVAHYPSLKEALQPVERALRDRPTLLLLDNLESGLPGPDGQTPAAAVPAAELFALAQSLLQASPATRLLLTSREPLPAPFDRSPCALGRLSRAEAIELVGAVLAEHGLAPAAADPGRTPQEIEELVEAVDGHARALVLLAPEVARRGVQATTANLTGLMAELEAKHPGDRQNSLYASLALSLRRLPPELREPVKALGVFHGGAHLQVWDYVLSIAPDDETTIPTLAAALIHVGLAEDAGYLHLRLDPALPAYLWAQLTPAEQTRLQSRWAGGMDQLADFLFQQRFQDAQLAQQLALLELPNLLALLAWVERQAPPPEAVVELATTLEQLLAPLGRPGALARVVAAREQAAARLGAWSHSHFNAEGQKIERLLEQGHQSAAYAAAQALLQHSQAAGETAYPGAAYDLAMAHVLLGQVLKIGGQTEAALAPLAEARRRFETLAEAGDTDAAQMASIALAKSGDCLTDLGRLDQAAAAYEEAIGRVEKLGNQRGVAVGKSQLGTVRLQQQRYREALDIYAEARQIFERLGEPGSVATAWHQIGMVHSEAGQFDRAEPAYRQALAISVQQKDRAGEAGSLTELGNLCDAMGRLEEAVAFTRQAADIHLELQDLFNEGKDCSNIANTLFKLGRFDEARAELHRAIECDSHFGHAAEPWKTWSILRRLEEATGHPAAAAQARQQAVEAYLAYRRDGGESHQRGTAYLCALVVQAIRERQPEVAAAALPELLTRANVSAAMGAKLQAVLAGERNPALADDPALDYDDAVELRLLLERLGN